MKDKLITLNMFKKWFPYAREAERIYEAFRVFFPQYNIDSINRKAGFLAQCGHESGGFRLNSENLNYSVNGLLKTFPRYFKDIQTAEEYAKQPEKIANKVYANRMNNGPEESGDGWKFRGRGYIQLTGKSNYMAFAKYRDLTLDDCIIYIESPEGSVDSALWFWSIKHLNRFCDRNDIEGMTRIINGARNGLEDRIQHYEKIKYELMS